MQQDYIIRIIEQFIQAIVSIMLKRKAGNHQEAIVQIQTASRYYLKTEIDTLLSYSPDKIADHFKDSANTLDSERCVICADLLFELALIFESQKQKEASIWIKTSCLHLYRTVITQGTQFQKPKYFERISALDDELAEEKNNNYEENINSM